VRSVGFEGLRVTREGALLPLVRTRTGSYLVFDRLREDLVRLFHTGLFEDVNYRLEFGPDDSVDVFIELEERAYGFYSLGIRYDNIDNVGLGLEVGQGNLGGSGASVRAALQLGDPTEFRFGLTGTRLFMLPFGYRVDGFWGEVDRQYYEQGRVQANYGIDYRGGIAEAGYILGRNAFFDIGATAYRAGYLVPDRAPPALDALPAAEWVIGPLFRLEYDDRAQPSLPSAGSYFSAHAFYATGLLEGGGEMARVEMRSGRAIPAGRRLLLGGGWDLGLAVGDSVFAEYFRTGAEDLPGFGRDEFVSPYKAVLRGGMDFRVLDLFGQAAYPLFLGVFANVATFRRLDGFVRQPDLLADLHWSAGVALRSNTPVGPLGIWLGWTDFAKPASFSYAPPRWSLFVSVGRDFRYTR
jgi:outer membrane protein assembly factor BamA